MKDLCRDLLYIYIYIYIRVIISSRMRWAVQVERRRERGGVYWVLIGKLEVVYLVYLYV